MLLLNTCCDLQKCSCKMISSKHSATEAKHAWAWQQADLLMHHEIGKLLIAYCLSH